MPRHCAFLFCCQFCQPQVIISRAFGEFGRHAARFLENEEGTVKRERGRKDTLAKLHLEEIFWRRMRILGTAYFVVLCTWGLTVLFFIQLEKTLILNSESTAIFQSFLTGYTETAVLWCSPSGSCLVLWCTSKQRGTSNLAMDMMEATYF